MSIFFSLRFLTKVNSEQTGAREGTSGIHINLVMCAKFVLLRIYYKRGAIKDSLDKLITKFCTVHSQFLGAFAKFRKATIGFIMSVCLFVPSVHPSARNNSIPTGRIFMKCGIRVLFENLPRKLKFH